MAKRVRYFDKTAGVESESNEKSKEEKVGKRPNKKRNFKVGDVIEYNVNLEKVNRFKKVNKSRPVKVIRKLPNPNPKYPGRAPIDKKLLLKHSRGEGIDKKGVRLKFNKYKLKQKENAIQFSTDLAARTEILLTEEAGLLEADAGETTTQFRQEEIVKNVDITAATKHFELHLNDFGPYRMRYTKNGRHLLLGGRMGHVAAFDWVTKKLHCEFNVMESVHDVCWLHIETMLAVAQKKWVYIYDNQGIELHCLKQLNNVARMQFLPYHFLLATASDEGYLSWLDVSLGQIVSHYNSKLGRLSMMCQNPWNAILCVGHAKGVVSMWSPNTREPLAKMLCHKSAMTALHVDPRGLYLATSGTDRKIKIWDIRKLEGPVQSYRPRACVTELAFSERSMLAMGMGNVVEVYNDCCTSTASRAYLRHVMNTHVSNMMFCPYEDVLGVATGRGFASLLVPGSGEPNFDALEANPFQTKKQRREGEVKALLEKIQPEFITLDPTEIADVDVPTLKDKMDAKTKLLYLKPPKIDFQSRKLKKNKSSVQQAKSKKIVQEETKRVFIQNIKNVNASTEKSKEEPNQKPAKVLDRFLPKKGKS